jgi:hypothetical protein
MKMKMKLNDKIEEMMTKGSINMELKINGGNE